MRNLVMISLLSCAFSAQAQPLQQGDYMPDFTFYNGSRLVSSAELTDKVLIINFWASWCGPCRAELVHIQNYLYNKYRYDNRVVLLVFGVNETARSLNAYQYYNGLNLPMFADTNQGIYKAFGDTYLPSTFIISPGGRIFFHSSGFPGNLNEINRQINTLLR